MNLLDFVVNQADLSQPNLIPLAKIGSHNFVEVPVIVPMIFLKWSKSWVLVHLRTVVGIKDLDWKDTFLFRHNIGHIYDVAFFHGRVEAKNDAWVCLDTLDVVNGSRTDIYIAVLTLDKVRICNTFRAYWKLLISIHKGTSNVMQK